MMRIAATLVFCALVCVSGKTNANDPIVDGLAYVRKSEMNAELKNIDAALPPRFNGSEIASDCKDGDSRAVCIPKANQTYVASSYNPATGWHNRSYITCNNNVSASRALPSSAPTFSALYRLDTLFTFRKEYETRILSNGQGSSISRNGPPPPPPLSRTRLWSTRYP